MVSSHHAGDERNKYRVSRKHVKVDSGPSLVENLPQS
jgi:hypothetical protein